MHPNFVSIIVCLILSAFFSGMEIAFVSANRFRIELDKKQGLFYSNIINIFLKNPVQFIVTLLLGNNVVLVIYGIEMAKILEPLINIITTNEFNILIIQTIVSTFLILFTAEFLPKAVFRLMSNFFLNYLSIPVLIFFIILYPITYLIMLLSHLFLKRFVKKEDTKQSDMYVFGKVDLNYLMEDAKQSGNQLLDTEHEIRIFQNALDFSKVKLRECMVPRTEIVAVEDTFTIEELRNKFISTGFSKILIYRGNIDNIIGYVSSKDLFKKPLSMKSKIIKAPTVPETMYANKLLRTLLRERKSLAVVVDEFGGTSGIVTTEDIMEEIFGEIEDEHDIDKIDEKVLGENEYIFSGRLQIDYLNKKYNLKFADSEEYETLAGYIFSCIGRIPVLNEKFSIGNFTFKILKINNKSLELIHLKYVEE